MSMLMMGIGGADPLAAAKAATRFYYGFQDSPNDTSGNGLHLAPVNSPTYVDGDVGRAAVFSAASSQYFNRAHDDLMCPTGAFSLVSFFRFGASIANRPLICKFHSSTLAQQSYYMGTTVGGALQFFTATDVGGSFTSLVHGSALTTGVDYRAICVYDGSNMQVMVHGVGTTATVAKTGTLNNSNSVPLRVGAYSSSAAGIYQDGRISTAWMTAKALTADEIAAIFAMTTDAY
jgi:hypothetical protein